MRITKFGHCCLLVEIDGLRVLTDPGNLSGGQNEVEDIDVVLITHEHADHFHTPSVRAVLKNNPQAVVVTNAAVGALLEKLGVAFERVEHGESAEKKGVEIEGFGIEHAAFHESIPNVQNTGYFVGGKLFFPGDAFTVPGKPVDVLALPVAGPWMKFSEAVEYAQVTKAKKCFPVHEGIMKSPAFVIQRMATVLEMLGIGYTNLGAGQTAEF
jgi:L-ascorbate metabolism protein UlaG (beta-lactamase superfamily)